MATVGWGINPWGNGNFGQGTPTTEGWGYGPWGGGPWGISTVNATGVEASGTVGNTGVNITIALTGV